jgi:cell division septum initiation protein DivIVA
MERLNQLYRDLVQEHERVGRTLDVLRHHLPQVEQEHERLKRENESLKAEVERLKAR